jgi:hypothetical protein
VVSPHPWRSEALMCKEYVRFMEQLSTDIRTARSKDPHASVGVYLKSRLLPNTWKIRGSDPAYMLASIAPRAEIARTHTTIFGLLNVTSRFELPMTI